MKTRLSHKFFCLLLTVVMACTLLPITALAAEPSGSIESAVITHDNGILKNAVSVELKDVTFAESVAVKLYSGDTPLTTATLKTGILAGGQNHPFVTCCIPTEGEDDAWSLTPWTPKDDVVPNKVVLFVDGNEMASKEFTLDDDEWAKLPGTVLPPSGTILRAYLNTDRITVDMADVTFYESVALELYSGETKLTTSTLNTNLAPASTYGELTGMIGLTATDEYWTYTAWTPKKDVVPDTVKLRVDGDVKDEAPLVVVFNGEETKPMTAEDWAALPGTAFPYTVTYLDGFSGTYATYTNLKSGDATPVPANPYRSGYIFLGWEPSVAPTVTGDARYVAQWGYIGPQYPNPTPVQPAQPGILPPQTGDMPLWYAIARFLGLVK